MVSVDRKLLDAAIYGDPEEAVAALEAGGDPFFVDHDGDWPAIYWAMLRGNKDLAARFIAAGSGPCFRSGLGRVLMLAVKWDRDDIVEYLLDAGANPNFPGAHGDTPLHCSAIRNFAKTARLLLERGADPNIKNKDGDTPLHLAIPSGFTEVISIMLAYNADPNIKNGNKNTPLMLAVKTGQVVAARLLGDAGADSRICDQRGQTPLHLAVQRLSLPLVEEILKLAPDLNIQDKWGSTPLHLAVEYRMPPVGALTKIVKALLSAGARPDLRDIDGRTPADLAEAMGHTGVAEILRTAESRSDLEVFLGMEARP